jgi:RNA polymerase sigma-70 factor (ECF subfamily)
VPEDEPVIVDSLIARGAAEYPSIREPVGLRALLERRAADAKPGELEARAGDLYLAAACVAGDAVAIAMFDQRLPATVVPALARIGVPASDNDEILQRTRVALLAPNDRGKCGLAEYTGRGELRAYVRAVAVRLALKRLQRETAPGSDDPSALLELVRDAHDSADFELLKQKYKADLRAAFATAFAALSPRERTLLRQHYLDGLTIDLLAPLYQVHRATCARWIEAARASVLREVRAHLRRTLGLDDRELDHAIELVRSQLDLSLNRQLTEPEG